ncbi:MAG: imidazolonepropionase [Proteobacteria bacterium]|nr:imidazolonepropionase [Pseudomonadota bacterium]
MVSRFDSKRQGETVFDLVIHNARIHSFRDGIGADARSLAVTDGCIVAIDPPPCAATVRSIDAKGRVLMPGFVDCHTHTVFAGERMKEHALKLAGASYEEIARAGGGIVSTVAAIRDAGVEQLVRESLPRLRALANEGVTTLEIKSGYGLSTELELRMLRAVAALRKHTGVDLVATFLGAHTVPKGRKKNEYLDEVVEKMLPAVAAENLADAVDIFVEKIAFDVDDMKRVFERARELGLKVKAHTDQLSNMGATKVAAEFGALSCDHLEHSNEDDIRAMADNGCVAVLLPGAFYFIRETKKPPVELLRKHGVPIAVATDLNPGSSPVASMLAAMHMSCIFFGLTAEEALLGATRNGARALGMQDRGALTVGTRADFTLWDIPAPEFLVYQLGGLRPTAVYIQGLEQ